MKEEPFKVTKEEMLEALSRSGYLLESEITKQLSDLGCFVESNLTTLDPNTGNSREIDLFVAESYMHANKLVGETMDEFMKNAKRKSK